MDLKHLFWLCLLTTIKKCNCYSSSIGCEYSKETSKYSCFGVSQDTNHFQHNNVDSSINQSQKSITRNITLNDRKEVKILEMSNSNTRNLNLHRLSEDFPNVIDVTISNSSITKLTGEFSSTNKIKVLRLTGLKIEEFPKILLHKLKLLEILDLRENRIRGFDVDVAEDLDNVTELSLDGNLWDCSLNLDWILKINVTSLNKRPVCYENPYPGKPLLEIAQFKNNVETNCPVECECWMPDVVTDPSNLELEPIIEVNCSDRNLVELPHTLPAKTKIVMLERNNIQNLEPLITNEVYRGVQDLYLDNNFVSSIKDLEGVHWFSHFRVLSLKNNKLKQLPTYALDNALQQNPNMPFAVRLYLGGNPWRCDCVFIPGFQEILRKYETQVKDIDDIRCSYLEGDENSLALIYELSRSSVCSLPSEYSVRALDLLNGVLASLIVLILGKLAYDYYHFKKTGRLPWIVTKMP